MFRDTKSVCNGEAFEATILCHIMYRSIRDAPSLGKLLRGVEQDICLRICHLIFSIL